jgi:hypothetical protein
MTQLPADLLPMPSPFSPSSLGAAAMLTPEARS